MWMTRAAVKYSKWDLQVLGTIFRHDRLQYTSHLRAGKREASSFPGPLAQALSLKGAQSVRTSFPGIRSLVCLLQRYSTHGLKPMPSCPLGGKRGGQNVKQNFILQQVCFPKQERRFGKVFGSGPSSAPGLTGSARLDWSPPSSLLPLFLSS